MQLVNEFRVPVPIDQAWKVLTDVERIAPCIPGAQLLSVDGDDFTGAVKVKVGPISVAYQGEASFKEKDATARRAVIKANGKETRGQGNAAAVVTLVLSEEGCNSGATTCLLTTDLTISGKAAQFGRGVLADVSSKLIGQFAQRLEADLQSTTPTATFSAPAAVPEEAAAVDLNLLSVIAAPLAKRALPVVGGLMVGLVLGRLLSGPRKYYVVLLPAN